MSLSAGLDFRKPEYRREVFHHFYQFHLRYRSHPGGVYYVLPHIAAQHEWDAEQRAWCAFLNGNTQNPVTTLLLMAAGDRPAKADAVLKYWRTHYTTLTWDTDRRHHKARFDVAVAGYRTLTGTSQERYWRGAAAGGWSSCWEHALAIPTMGRLSAWSYLEYVKILGVADIPQPDTLMLDDKFGSRSHRNGLLLLMGLDDLVWWKNNPDFHGNYDRTLYGELELEGGRLLAEARAYDPGNPDIGYLTLESALCTWKSWHRPNRRYPGVYNDLLYDRLKSAEARHGHRFGEIWDARRRALPAHMRLEDTPGDPGAVPMKQNHYLTTGEVIGMDYDWPYFANSLRPRIDSGELARERKWKN